MLRPLIDRAWAKKRLTGPPRGFESTEPQSFMLRQDKRYRATITLTGIESWAGNGTIADKFAELGFADAEVTGRGGTRKGEARWPLPDQTVPLPLDPHLSEVEEIVV